MDGPITEAEKLREERDAALERVAELEGPDQSPLGRIRDLDMHFGARDLDPDETYCYRWDGGYETLISSGHGGNGGFYYAGQFHPGDGRCVGDPCRFCGGVAPYWESDMGIA